MLSSAASLMSRDSRLRCAARASSLSTASAASVSGASSGSGGSEEMLLAVILTLVGVVLICFVGVVLMYLKYQKERNANGPTLDVPTGALTAVSVPPGQETGTAMTATEMVTVPPDGVKPSIQI